ncbi:MAG: ATP-binding protein [Eubacteriales bacterium]|nr:ATP-binding protein [Eubacteriales bacterium]
MEVTPLHINQPYSESNGMDIDELREQLSKLQAAGVPFSTISTATGVHRSTISQFVNQGIRPARYEQMHSLMLYVSAHPTIGVAQANGSHKQNLELWEHEEYKAARGWCNYIIDNRKIGVIMGAPGTGKTTLLKSLMVDMPSCIYIEATSNMRVTDLINTIARAIGVSVSGNGYERYTQLLSSLQWRKELVILVDEAECLKKWDVEKYEYLRKIWDNTGTPIIITGTPELEKILTRGTGRGNLAQLYRRKYELQLKGVSASEALAILRQYNCTTDASQMLSQLAGDTAHGGLGTMCETLDLCLKTAAGGQITADMVTAAKKYKMMY